MDTLGREADDLALIMLQTILEAVKCGDEVAFFQRIDLLEMNAPYRKAREDSSQRLIVHLRYLA